MGDVIVRDVALALRALVAEVGEANRAEPNPLPEPSAGGGERSAHADDGSPHPRPGLPRRRDRRARVAVEHALAPQSAPPWDPGSYYFAAGGGLGFGLAAAIGVQLAQPDRPVLCVLGEGSAQYAVTGFWTAAAYDVPVTFLILRNEEYAILKWFADVEEVTGAPASTYPRSRSRRWRRPTGSRPGRSQAARSSTRRSPRRSPREAQARRGPGHPRHGALLRPVPGPAEHATVDYLVGARPRAGAGAGLGTTRRPGPGGLVGRGGPRGRGRGRGGSRHQRSGRRGHDTTLGNGRGGRKAGCGGRTGHLRRHDRRHRDPTRADGPAPHRAVAPDVADPGADPSADTCRWEASADELHDTIELRLTVVPLGG